MKPEINKVFIETKDRKDDTTERDNISSDTDESDVYVGPDPEVPTSPPDIIPDVSLGDVVFAPTKNLEVSKEIQRKYGDWTQGIIVGFSDDRSLVKLMFLKEETKTVIVDTDIRYLRKESSIIDVANRALIGDTKKINILISELRKAKEDIRMRNLRYEENMLVLNKEKTEMEVKFNEESNDLHDRIRDLEKQEAESQLIDVEGSMENTLQTIRAQQPYIDSLLQINAYKDHNSSMKQDMRERLIVLDHKYSRYANIINGIQISIIIFSAMTAFVQASSDSTQISDAAAGFISLCVATYTSLLLGISKYMKYDEKKEVIHNLQQQFASFIVKLEARDDKLNTWCSDSFWAGHKIDDKRKEWVEMERNLKQEFVPLIEDKANLCCEFEKNMSTEEQKQLAISARNRSLTIRLQKNSLLEKEIDAVTQANILKSKMKKLEGKKKKLKGSAGYSGQSVLRATAMNANTAPPGPVPASAGGCSLCERALAKKGEKLCEACIEITSIRVGKEVIVTADGLTSKARVKGIDVEAGRCTVEYLDDSVMIRPTDVSISDITVEMPPNEFMNKMI